MLVNRGHRGKLPKRPMPQHVFAHQNNGFGLFICTIGLARAETKLMLVNLAYDFDRLIFHERGCAKG